MGAYLAQQSSAFRSENTTQTNRITAVHCGSEIQVLFPPGDNRGLCGVIDDVTDGVSFGFFQLWLNGRWQYSTCCQLKSFVLLHQSPSIAARKSRAWPYLRMLSSVPCSYRYLVLFLFPSYFLLDGNLLYSVLAT